MTDSRSLRILWAMALLLLAIGAGATVSTVTNGARLQRDCQQAQATARGLRQLAVGDRQRQAAIDAFGSLDKPRAVEAADLVRRVLPNAAVTIAEREREPVSGGWVYRQVDVAIQQMQLAAVGDLLRTVEEQRPPWRIVACSFTPTVDRIGYADVTLALATLEPPH